MDIFLTSAKSKLKYSLYKTFYHCFNLFFNFGFDKTDLFIFFWEIYKRKQMYPAL